MESIREEDRGTETMVFEMTSIQLNSELQFCIGNAYENNGKDRYNVYLVKNGRVHGCIGHYDVPQGESTVDAGGKDFDVMKYKEPSWLIDPSFHLLEKGKPEKKEKEKATPKPPKAKSLFRVIITADDGNCFYDTLVRSMDGNDVEVYNEEKVKELREELGEYITTTGEVTLLEKYHYSVEAVSGKPFSMKNDPYYGKYYARQEKGESEDDIVAAIEQEIAADPSIEGKLNADAFRDHKGEDPTVNKYNEAEVKEAARHFLEDYFQNEMALSDVDVVEVFKENIEKDKVWASELIILQAEKKYNVKFLLLKKGAASEVEQYAADDLDTYKVIDADTKFIIIEYTPLQHFKLIVQDKKKRFSMAEVPAIIKAKFAMFQGQEPQVLAAAQDAQQEKLETPAVEVDSGVEFDDDGPKYTKEKLEKMTNQQLEDILKAEFVGVPVSTLSGKSELIDCILKPDQEKCKKKKPTKRASLAPDAPSGDDAPSSDSPAPTTTYTREQLSGMSKSKLEEILKTYPNVSWTTVGKKGKEELIDCILNPSQEKCLSKKAKKTGGNYTRKQVRQLA
jgi:hypothetical protein